MPWREEGDLPGLAALSADKRPRSGGQCSLANDRLAHARTAVQHMHDSSLMVAAMRSSPWARPVMASTSARVRGR